MRLAKLRTSLTRGLELTTNKMGESTINGDMPSSKFISVCYSWSRPISVLTTPQHVTSYPVVADSIETVKKNPYGAKGIDLTNSAYSSFVKPTFPYLQTPYEYTKPYIAKADSIGDSVLGKVDERIPILKSETKEIKSTIFDFAHWPFVQASKSKDYVLNTYSEEYKKCGGDGYVAGTKALITSQLVITSDVLHWFSSFVNGKKEQAKPYLSEKLDSAKSLLNQKTEEASNAAEDAKNVASKKGNEAANKVNEKAS